MCPRKDVAPVRSSTDSGIQEYLAHFAPRRAADRQERAHVALMVPKRWDASSQAPMRAMG